MCSWNSPEQCPEKNLKWNWKGLTGTNSAPLWYVQWIPARLMSGIWEWQLAGVSALRCEPIGWVEAICNFSFRFLNGVQCSHYKPTFDVRQKDIMRVWGRLWVRVLREQAVQWVARFLSFPSGQHLSVSCSGVTLATHVSTGRAGPREKTSSWCSWPERSTTGSGTRWQRRCRCCTLLVCPRPLLFIHQIDTVHPLPFSIPLLVWNAKNVYKTNNIHPPIHPAIPFKILLPICPSIHHACSFRPPATLIHPPLRSLPHLSIHLLIQ